MKLKLFLLLLAALLPAILAYAILYLQAYSPPFQDDYHAILSFAADYQQRPTWTQKILAIAVEQHNEYKLGFEHAVVVGDLQLTHHLDFRFLSALGNLTLLPIAYLLWRTYREPGSDAAGHLFTFLPISFLFFALTYWETLNWAMSGLQNIPVIFFSLLAIYLLIPRATLAPSWGRLFTACVAAALAAFTSANGFLLVPVGLLILLARRAYTQALLWCLSFALPLAAYLYHTTPLVQARHPYYYLTRPLFFLAFLGGVIPFRWAAVLFGLVVGAVLLLALRSRYDLTNPVASYFALWILATAGLVAWVRGSERLYVASRYSIYSSLLLIFCYGFLTHHLAVRYSSEVRKRFCVASLFFAVAWCVAADAHAYQKLGERRRLVLDGIAFYRANPALNSPMIDPRIKRIAPEELPYERDMLTEAIHKGIYTLECNGCRFER